MKNLMLSLRKQGSCFLLLTFLFNTLGPMPVAQANDFVLPKPGAMIHLSPAFNPPVLRGIKVDPQNPFQMEFVLDQGDTPSRLPSEQGLSVKAPEGRKLLPNELKQESQKLIKYFLASMTVPEKDLWVNLSPYEKNRIIPDAFGKTEMGRDLLAQDYILKQITASLTYPDGEIGRKFWQKIYKKIYEEYSDTSKGGRNPDILNQITVNVGTFNKVWIVPDKTVVYENKKIAYIVESKLKVMLEEDYTAFYKNAVSRPAGRGVGIKTSGKIVPVTILKQDTHAFASKIIREIIIPELTKEVNEGKNFAPLRQVYNSLVLANWYKKKLKNSILAKVYVNQNKVNGITLPSGGSRDIEAIYHKYLQAFKKGAYNLIKEEKIPYSFGSGSGGQTILRKYFSGGAKLFDNASITPQLPDVFDQGNVQTVAVRLVKKRSDRVQQLIKIFTRKEGFFFQDNQGAPYQVQFERKDDFFGFHIPNSVEAKIFLKQTNQWMDTGVNLRFSIEKGGVKSVTIIVPEQYRRKGIATALYKIILDQLLPGEGLTEIINNDDSRQIVKDQVDVFHEDWINKVYWNKPNGERLRILQGEAFKNGEIQLTDFLKELPMGRILWDAGFRSLGIEVVGSKEIKGLFALRYLKRHLMQGGRVDAFVLTAVKPDQDHVSIVDFDRAMLDNKPRDIKAVFLDLDETLAQRNQNIDQTIINILVSLARQGKKIVIVTEEQTDRVIARVINKLPKDVQSKIYIASEGGARIFRKYSQEEKNQLSSVGKNFGDWYGFQEYSQKSRIDKMFREMIYGRLGQLGNNLKYDQMLSEDITGQYGNSNFNMIFRLLPRYKDKIEDIVSGLNRDFKNNNIAAKAYIVHGTIRIVRQHKENAIEALLKKWKIAAERVLIMGNSANKFEDDREMLTRFSDAINVNVGTALAETIVGLIQGWSKNVEASKRILQMLVDGRAFSPFSVKEVLDAAMQTPGGIDLSSDKAMQIKNEGEETAFNIDPAQLQYWQNVQGFVPVIVDIKPLADLRVYLNVV